MDGRSHAQYTFTEFDHRDASTGGAPGENTRRSQVVRPMPHAVARSLTPDTRQMPAASQPRGGDLEGHRWVFMT